MEDLKKQAQVNQPTASGLHDHDNRELSNNHTSGVQTLLESSQGFIVGRMGNEFLRFNTDTHLLTISPTGGGKGTGLIIPNLLDHPGSAFVVDIRGETVAKTATARMLQGQHIVVIDPYQITGGKWGYDRFNPLDVLAANKNNVGFDDMVQRLTQALMFDPSGRQSNEPIWDNATKSLISGLLTLCVKYWPSDLQNLLEVLKVLNHTPEEREKFISKLQDLVNHHPEAKTDQKIKGLLSLLTDAKTTTKITDNALIQAQTLLSWVGNKSFREVLEDSSFSFDDLHQGDTTVYLVIPEEFIDNCATWVRMILETAVFSIPDLFGKEGKNTAHLFQDERILFLLDELPAFGKLDIISKGMATLRGRGINLWLFVQNKSQLEATYGKEMSNSIFGNISCLQVFKSQELEELKYFSEVIGEEFHDVQSFSAGVTQTEGSSQTQGTSSSVSNSESITHTKGTSDSSSEANSVNWSEAYSKSRSKTFSKGKGGSRGSGSSYNRNKGKGHNYKRNSLFGAHREGHNTNRGKGWQSSKNSGASWNKGRSKTRGWSKTTTEGGGQTFTHQTSTNESEGRTNQTSQGQTTSESQTTNSSTANNRSVTVKLQRMKIETVRTLREKLSGRNQLLMVSGKQPFFAPRMSYFIKFLDRDRYMFPDMTAMATIDIFEKTAALPIITNSINTDVPSILKNSSYQSYQQLFSQAQSEHGITDNQSLQKAAGLYGTLLEFGLDRLCEKRTKNLQTLNEDYDFEEPTRLILVMCELLYKVWQNDQLVEIKDNTLNAVFECEDERNRIDNLHTKFRRYRNIQFKDVEPAKLAEISSEKVSANSHTRWMVHTYSPIIQSIFSIYDDPNAGEKKRLQVFEQTRLKLQNSIQRLGKVIAQLISEAHEAQIERKQNFFINKLG